MSNVGKFHDFTPFITPAGLASPYGIANVDHSIRQDLHFKSATTTPPNLTKYRKTIREIPGTKQYHRGIFDDPKDYESYIHGVKSKESLHVPDCIRSSLDGTKLFLNQLKEKTYASSKREPLGHSIVRNYKFPDQVKSPSFQFGLPTSGKINAKELIYTSPLTESEEVKAMYKRTHNIYGPGEQKSRNYAWKFDNKSHVFGKVFEKEVDGVKKSLDYDDKDNDPSIQVNPRVENFRYSKNSVIGKSKAFGSVDSTLHANRVFGIKSDLSNAWNVGKCINGDPVALTEQQVACDVDLGRSVKYKIKLKKLKPIEFDTTKVFGLPSIRTDKKKKEFVSVTDNTNYGDEKDAFELLYPHPCAVRGLDDEDFDVMYTKEEIYEFIKENGIELPEEEYNVIYDTGLKNYPNDEGKMSVNQFIYTMRNFKREYNRKRVALMQ